MVGQRLRRVLRTLLNLRKGEVACDPVLAIGDNLYRWGSFEFRISLGNARKL